MTRIWGAGLRSAFIVAALFAAWEVVDQVAREGLLEDHGLLSAVGAWHVSFSLCLTVLVLGTCIAAPLFLICSGGASPAALVRKGSRWLREWLRVRNDDPQRIGRVVGFFFFLAGFMAATFGTAMYSLEHFNKPVLIAGATVCFATAALFGAALLGFAISCLLARVGRWKLLRPPWYSMASLCIVLAVVAVAATGYVVYNWSTWLPGVRAFHFVHVVVAFAICLLLAALFLHLLEPAEPGTPSGQRGKRKGTFSSALLRGIWQPPAVAALAVLSLVLTLGPVGSESHVRRVSLTLHGQTLIWADIVRQVTDFDRDGYSHYMGGGDCDPFNGAVAPGKADIPDNGIDEDCFDGDLTASQFMTSHDPEWYEGSQLVVKPYDVVIIGGDGIRFDHTSLSGYFRDTTPFLKRWAEERGTVFELAHCNVPYTGFSHMAMLTGMLPLSVMELGKGVGGRTDLPTEFTSLFEYLKGRGYQTAGVDTTVKKWAPWVSRGLDKYKLVRSARASGVSAQIISAFRKRKKNKPFLLWAFYYDAHHPYIIDGMEHVPSFGDTPEDQYDRRLLFWDMELEQLFKELGPQLEDAIVIFYSDHGEEVSAEEWVGHGKKITQEHVHVPFVISVPGLIPRRIRQPVSLIDLFPTLVNFIAGDGEIPNPVEGKSLARQMLTGHEADRRLVFTETYRGDVRYAVTDGRYKLKLDLTRNQVSFYDLDEDPAETRHLEGVNPEVELELERAVRHYVVGRRGYWKSRAEIAVQSDSAPPGMDQPLAMFGEEIALLGAEVKKAGRNSIIDVYYRCEKEMDKDYRATTHALNKKTGKFRNLDHAPASLMFGTSEWVPGKIYRDRIKFPSYCGSIKNNNIWIGFHKSKEKLEASSKILPLRQKKTLLNAAIRK